MNNTPSPPSAPASASPPSKVLSYLRLFRLPNVFTAMADILMGFLFVNRTLEPIGSVLGLLLASSFLYTAGMILNDVFDLEVDRRERPHRPLPSGQIDVGWAKTLGFSMLAAGIAVAWLTGFLDPRDGVAQWRSGAVATALALCVFLYDIVLKKTLLGPVAMGACRFGNVLLGMSLMQMSDPVYSSAELTVATGIAVYIVGVTWFARTEATESKRGMLALAMGVMMAGIGVLAYIPFSGEMAPMLKIKSAHLWPLTLGIMALPIVRRCLAAIIDPSPRMVQAAVKNCIVSLIILDAVLCLATLGPTYAFGILALAVPMHLLGKWVYST